MNAYIRSTLVASLALLAAPTVIADIPPRPEQLVFAPLKFEPPSAKEFRRTLPNGVPVYMGAERGVPARHDHLQLQGRRLSRSAQPPGSHRSPRRSCAAPARPQSSPLTSTSSSTSLRPAPRSRAAAVSCTASLNCLKSNLDDSFKLFMDMLRNPGFDEERVERAEGNSLEDLKQRNDSGDTIMDPRVGPPHLRPGSLRGAGDDTGIARAITAATCALDAPAHLPSGNLIISVTGDFEPSAMMARLEKGARGLAEGRDLRRSAGTDGGAQARRLSRAEGHPQGKVYLGLRSLKRDDPDYLAVMVMNDILGGGGFTSRIMQSVRSNEGLAYSAGSSVEPNVWYPGEFRALFQSKNPTVALAIKLINDELDRIRREPVSKAELETTQKSFVETFPQNFSSKDSMLRIFVTDEMTIGPRLLADVPRQGERRSRRGRAARRAEVLGSVEDGDPRRRRLEPDLLGQRAGEHEGLLQGKRGALTAARSVDA
jgi:zinc protease